MIDAYGYCRVSSLGQAAADRGGLSRQRAAVTKWAALNDVEIVDFYSDAITGTSEWGMRPQFQTMMTAMLKSGVKTIVIERLDRIARDLLIQEKIIQDLRENGFELISTCEPDLCSEDPSRKLMRQIMGAIAEYDKSMLVAKLAAGRASARLLDPTRRVGQKDFGFREGEQATIARIVELRSCRISVREIVERLNTERRATRKGKGWHANQVVRILARAGAK